jgi:hypothetical protein
MEYAVKAKFLEPPMSNLEFLNALKEHYPLGVKKAWIVAKPQTLQEAAAFLSDVADLENNQMDLEPRRPTHYNRQNNPQSPHQDPRNENRGGWSRETTCNDNRYHGKPDTRRVITATTTIIDIGGCTVTNAEITVTRCRTETGTEGRQPLRMMPR